MTTVRDWVAQVREHLEPGRSRVRNMLAADYAPGDGQLTMRYELGATINLGAILSVGLNTFHAWEANTTAKQVTVTGGEDGSSDVACADGDVVLVNPRWSTASIVRALNTELHSLSSPVNGLYQTRSVTLDYSSSVVGYDLATTDLLGIVEVRREDTGPEESWPALRAGQWSLFRDAPTDFASGTALRLMEGDTGRRIYVVYKAAFMPVTALTQDAGLTGLPDTAYDLPPLGAAIQLLSGADAARNQTGSQPDTRRSSEVPPGALTDSLRPLMSLRQRRVHEESANLARRHTVRR